MWEDAIDWESAPLEALCRDCPSFFKDVENGYYNCLRFNSNAISSVCLRCPYKDNKDSYSKKSIDQYNVNTFLEGDPDE